MFKPDIEKLHKVWNDKQNKAVLSTLLPEIKFEEIINSIIGTGPFYFYIIDFYDMSLSNVSPSIHEIHGLDHKTVTFDQILETIHPDDMDFVSKAEANVIEMFYKKIGYKKLLTHKVNYSFRSRMKNGQYKLLNHQALVLTLDEKGGFGKSLNIHTQIDHLSNVNTFKYSIISLNNEKSYMNLNLFDENNLNSEFSKREIQIIKLISDGFDNTKISILLFISVPTVKKHRTNILKKTHCTNTPQLIKYCVLQGLI